MAKRYKSSEGKAGSQAKTNRAREGKMTITKQGNKAVIELDLTPEGQAPLSTTGKSKIAYTSRGFKFEQGLGVSINIIYSKR